MQLRFQKIKDHIRGRDVGIILGAGISCGPSWPNLIKLMYRGIYKDSPKIQSSHYLDLAGIVEKDFADKIRTKLESRMKRQGLFFPSLAYQQLTQFTTTAIVAAYVQTLLKSQIQEAERAIHSGDIDNTSIAHIADCCIERWKNHRRTIVVSYNYDDLFEHLLIEKIRSRIDIGDIDTGERPEKIVRTFCYSHVGTEVNYAMKSLLGNDAHHIDLYYVHGRLPLFRNSPENYHDGIILSDQSYDDLKRRIIAFSNQIQYAVMSAYPVLAMGFSGDDPNFVRLRKDLLMAGTSLPPAFLLYFCGNDSCPCCPEQKEKCHGDLSILKFRDFLPLVANKRVYASIVDEVLAV